MKKKYRFYYRFQNYGKEFTVEIKKCIKPNRTKVYKRLKESFEQGFIASYGWVVINN